MRRASQLSMIKIWRADNGSKATPARMVAALKTLPLTGSIVEKLEGLRKHSGKMDTACSLISEPADSTTTDSSK
jgi:hypothetical protein